MANRQPCLRLSNYTFYQLASAIWEVTNRYLFFFFKLFQIAKDAKECVQECVSEFISFITSEYPFLLTWLFLFITTNVFLLITNVSYKGALARNGPYEEMIHMWCCRTEYIVFQQKTHFLLSPISLTLHVFLASADFFEINFFKKSFRDIVSVKLFGSKSDVSYCDVGTWFCSKL